MKHTVVKGTKESPWVSDPTGDVANAYAIPEDEGLCLLCFGDKNVTIDFIYRAAAPDYKMRKCPLCKGTGKQTPELVRAYKHGDLNLDLLTTLA